MRRILIAAAILAPFLIGAGWQKWEQDRTDRWIAAVSEIGFDVEVGLDEGATSPVGRLRNWLQIPVVQVFVWGQDSAQELLRAPAGGPACLQIHLNEGFPTEMKTQLALRFPRAELRTSPRWGSSGF